MATLTTPPAGAPELEQTPVPANEPSMEDILASIRRIIAEDQSNSLGRSAPAGFARRAPAAAAAAEPVLAAREDEIAPNRLQPAFPDVPDSVEDGPGDGLRGSHAPEVVAHDDVVDAAPEPAISVAPVSAPLQDAFVQAELAVAEPVQDLSGDEAPLISHAAGASITSSFHALAESVLLQDPAMIERVTRDTLRPMLKSWLDDNLPSIVERLVRGEIERVARGGRSRD